jgi:hypothetical protein
MPSKIRLPNDSNEGGVHYVTVNHAASKTAELDGAIRSRQSVVSTRQLQNYLEANKRISHALSVEELDFLTRSPPRLER